MTEAETHAKWLEQVAAEIAKAGHNGWGNTCLDAARFLRVLTAPLQPTEVLINGPTSGSTTTKHVLRVPEAAPVQPTESVADTQRLDWLDSMNDKLNQHYGTKYGWRFDANHNRNVVLSDMHTPAVTVREAIDCAMREIAPVQPTEPVDVTRDPRVLLAACLLHKLPSSLRAAIQEHIDYMTPVQPTDWHGDTLGYRDNKATFAGDPPVQPTEPE